MTGIDDRKKAALSLGACNKVESVSSISEALALLMTPQGREFAVKTGFPSLEMWREQSVIIDRIPHVLLDAPKCVVNGQDLIVIGNTEVVATYNEPDKLHHIIAMHGAKVTVVANNYAVVTVSSYDAEIEFEGDDTALIYTEDNKEE